VLDRFAIADVLRELTAATVVASSTAKSRPELLHDLLALCDSEFERKWLRTIDVGHYRLPTSAQTLVESCGVRPDFIYADHQAVVFIDGPYHDYEENKSADASKTACLEDLGYQVIRFGSEETWAALLSRHPDVFGDGQP
jgi:hypothetical protein